MYLYLYLKCISLGFPDYDQHCSLLIGRPSVGAARNCVGSSNLFPPFPPQVRLFLFSLFWCKHLWRRHLVALDVISSAIHSLTSFESSLQQIFVTAKPANDLLFADTWTSYLAGTTPGWNLVGKSQAIKPSILGDECFVEDYLTKAGRF